MDLPKSKNFSLLLGFLLFQQITMAQTLFVSGHITKDTTWIADTVKIVGNITVENGKTLTINKGTYIQCQGYYKFFILGSIKAIGALSDSIYFSVSDTAGFSRHTDTTGSWGGFCFTNTPVLNDSSKFEYCKVQYCKKIKENGGVFSIFSYPKLKISHCLIINNSCDGEGGSIYCWESNPIIIYNTFSYNYSSGHGGAICYVNKISDTYFSDNTLIYNYSQL